MKTRVALGKALSPFLILFIFGFSSCTMLPDPLAPIEKNPTNPIGSSTIQNSPIVVEMSTQTITLASTPTFVPSKTPSPTPKPMQLDYFSYNFKPNEVSPIAYLDTCQYLSNRWGEDKSEPGTIVVPVMYHSVRKSGRPLVDEMQVSQEYFEYTMDYAKKMGFETITTEELVGFLYNNDPIPTLSMILIIDDRRLGVVDEHFMKFLNENDWTVTLAYITGVATANEWREFARLNINHRLDLQAHGFFHNGETYITETTALEVIEQELNGPIPIIEEQSGRKPQAFIWPGGNFTTESVQIAREAGYEIGFTAYSRGPLMYNWIPLGAIEAKTQDPLMVLPRFWSNTAALYLERASEISMKAQEFASQNQSNEYIWYQNYCNGFPILTEFDYVGMDQDE